MNRLAIQKWAAEADTQSHRRSMLAVGALATTLLLLLGAPSSPASLAEAYDYGCQYLWTGPDADNSLSTCMQAVPSDNPGVLVPPIIPLVFLLIVVIFFPLSFLCRCCGGCGSNEQRPGAACCCDGEEWDEIPEEEKEAVYPTGHIFCIKILCLLVFLLAIIPIILVPIGFTEFKAFWDGCFTSIDRDIVQWIIARLSELKVELSNGDGTYIDPVTPDMFASVEDIIYDLGNQSADFNSGVVSHFDNAFTAIGVLSAIPLILLSFLLLFILCNVRKCLPACCTCVYFVVLVVFALFSILGMFLGVVGVMTCGEVTLFRTQSPGIFAWWAVPLCEKEAPFTDLKAQIASAERDSGIAACNQLLEICDQQPFASNVTKPFNCSITSSNVNTRCAAIGDVATILNETVLKENVPPGVVCTTTNCSVYSCPEDCVNNDLKNQTREARDLLNKGIRALSAIRKAFTYADCDTLITRFLLPFKECNHLSVGSFLIAAGAGLGGLFLLFGIILQMKGQKLFFKKHEDQYLENQ